MTYNFHVQNQFLQKEDKIVLLRKACDQHTKLTQEAMTGQGIDRHLFCLYVISKYLEIESPFLTVSINVIPVNKKSKHRDLIEKLNL